MCIERFGLLLLFVCFLQEKKICLSMQAKLKNQLLAHSTKARRKTGTSLQRREVPLCVVTNPTGVLPVTFHV